MIQRCENPSSPAFHHYGGRGIRVCERWHAFLKFAEDMGDPPEGLTLDRIDNDKGYCPENCRWATRDVQASNKRNTVRLTMNGETKPLHEWASALGIKYSTVYMRHRKGWPVERILSVDDERKNR